MRNLARVIIRLLATIGFAIPFVGLPVGLVTLVGWPLPHRWPTTGDWIRWGTSTHPLTGRVLLDGAACALWVLWAWLVAYIARETLRSLLRLRLPHPHVPVHHQHAVSSLIGIAVLGASRAATLLHTGGDTAPAGHAAPLPVAAADTGTGVAATSHLTSDRNARPGPGAGSFEAAEATTATTPSTGALLSTRPTTSGAGPAHVAPPTTVASGTAMVHASTPLYTVVEGDTLWDIAATHLHDPTRWTEIYHLNTGRYDQNGRMLGGDHIEPGWVLELPDDAVPPQDAHPTAPPAGIPSTPPAQTPALPSSPATPSPTPSTSAPTPAPSGSQTRPTSPSSARSPRVDRGVSLPGGWVPIGLAAALLAAASLVWLRRRHRYRPRLLDAPGRLDDTKPKPLPPTIRRLRRGVQERLSSVPPAVPDAVAGEEPIDQATVPGPPDSHRHLALDPIGPDGPTLAGLPALIPATGLSLTGPGAHAAARALLVATLSTGSPDDPDARGHVVVPTTVLTTLLGVDAVHVPSLPRLHVTADLPAALTHLDGLLLYRRRLLEEDGATDLAELREHNPYHEPMPPTLLIAEAPADTVRARLDTTLTLGAPLQVSAVLLGESASATGVVVDAQGHTDSDQLAVLDTPSTLDLLAVLAEAHTGEAPNLDPAEPSSVTSPCSLSSSGSAGAVAAEEAERPSGPSAPPDTAHRLVPVRVLGPPAILTVDDDVVPGLRGKAREMLVYLALHRSGANLPDIQEALWPEATVRRAGERLATEVGNLRRRIREAAGDASVQPVVNTGGRYHLSPELLDIDWWRLQDNQAAATNTTEPDQRLALLRQALEALHGPLAEGCDYDWIPEHLEHARRVAIELHAQLADLLTTTAPEEAAHLIEVATAIDPYNEQLARQAMTIHAQLDQPEAIRNDLRRLRVALTDIDLEPEADTVALATTLLHQPVGAPKAAPG